MLAISYNDLLNDGAYYASRTNFDSCGSPELDKHVLMHNIFISREQGSK